MIVQLVSVFDKATMAYMRPFVALSVGQAVRLFEDEVMTPGSEIAKHAEDYALFKVGTFNDSIGLVEPCEPLCLRRAHEIPRNPEPMAVPTVPRATFNQDN